MSTKTKFILTYVGGIVTGVILMFVFALVVNSTQQGQANSIDRDVVMFEKPQQTIRCNKFQVFQVLPNGSALASGDDDNLDYLGMVVMFLSDDGSSYFDDQKIVIPSGKCVRQIGTYKYMTRQNLEKTVPVVEIMDK